jgi:hypothetical protein
MTGFYEIPAEVTRQLSAIGRSLAVLENKMDRLLDAYDTLRRAQADQSLRVRSVRKAVHSGVVRDCLLILVIGALIALAFVR